MYSVEDIGRAIVVLAVVLGAAQLIRRYTPTLRALFIPTAVIGGFLMLLLGPEVLGRITGGDGLFPTTAFGAWTALPGQLVNVMCAAMLLGERLPPLGKIWQLSAPNVIYSGLSSFGQFAIGGLLVLLVLAPLFDMSDLGGSLVEISFSGGHGTVAGLGGIFEENNASELVALGYGLATVGLIAAVVVGTLLVNFAVKSPSIPIARDRPTSPEDDYDINHHAPGPDDPPMDENKGMAQVSAAAVFIGIAIAIAIVLLAALRWSTNQVGLTVFDHFPLFPLTIIGGVIVQLAAVRFGFEWAVNRRAVEGIGGIATDGVVICAIGTLSLGELADSLGPLLILSAASIAWSAFMVFALGRRFFATDWFENAITEFGEHQGNLATGYMMLDMVDPARKTEAVYGFSYRQLITRPLIGGGLVSALSVPMINSWGLTTFTIVAALVALAMAAWGFLRMRRRTPEAGAPVRATTAAPNPAAGDH